ncbi:hypothetical protein MFLO_04470 [Listeria floridensis FSL S10-1187]|uniref:HutD family protein n=1 Tax=Listeria floridensis FSL S10-1187 TaxID=1265817 RepID=A0ABP3B1G3_9LIST|nr:HutD family protein [Listeria floridensis]EUJ33161.1 hypothetical protein MFLO_04470 [Listeria floridensis FSL S10-1187]
MEKMIKRKSDYKKSIWTGGTTTELLIWPETALYEARDFAYRISTATVSLPKSTFTSLPSYERKLLILDGEIELQHEADGKMRQERLAKFSQDSFGGSEITTSYGQCIDFNIIYTPAYTATLSLVDSEGKYQLSQTADYFYYALAEEILVHFPSEETVKLQKGDSLFLSGISGAAKLFFTSTYSSSGNIAVEAKMTQL